MGKAKRSSRKQKSSTLFYIVLAFVVAIVGILLASSFTDIAGEAVSPFAAQKTTTESTFTTLIEGSAGFTTATVTIPDKGAYYTVTLDENDQLVGIQEGVVEHPDFTVSLNYYTLLSLQYGEESLHDAIAVGKVQFSSSEPVSLEQLDVVISSIDITAFS